MTKDDRSQDLAEVLRLVVREELRAVKSDALLDSREAHTKLNISLRTLDDLVARGEIEPVRIGRKRLFRASDLNAFVERKAKRRGV